MDLIYDEYLADLYSPPRPYFMEREEEKEASSTDEGTCSRRTEDSSLRTDEMSRRTEESLPHRRASTRTEDFMAHRRVSERSNSSLLNSPVSVVKPRVSATGKELCHQHTVDEEAVSPFRTSPASLVNTCYSRPTLYLNI